MFFFSPFPTYRRPPGPAPNQMANTHCFGPSEETGCIHPTLMEQRYQSPTLHPVTVARSVDPFSLNVTGQMCGSTICSSSNQPQRSDDGPHFSELTPHNAPGLSSLSPLRSESLCNPFRNALVTTSMGALQRLFLLDSKFDQENPCAFFETVAS